VNCKFLLYPLQFIIVYVLWQIPFSILLRKPGEDNLERFYETFHGANISIQVSFFSFFEESLQVHLCVESTICIIIIMFVIHLIDAG
jgi:ABC-type uncharacterized transport system permease subunit